MKGPLQIAARMAAQLHYKVWLFWRGKDRPDSGEDWDDEYRLGKWDYLNSLEELDHYSVIVGYIGYWFERPDILDVGCGQGRLLRLLHPGCFNHYTGMDHSGEAIARASRIHASNTLLVTADFEKWFPPTPVDVIVFNESLYYGRDPVGIVKRFLQSLKPGGKIIVSMHECGNHRNIWTQLDSTLGRVHGIHLCTDCGQKWLVRVFDPSPKSLITA